MKVDAPRDEIEQVSEQLSQIVNKLWQWHESSFCPVDSWSPPINMYKLDRRYEVCVDLAGLQPKSIDVRVEPGTLTIRGVRHAPEPVRLPSEPMRILAMEIDHGAFCRQIPLPDQIDLTRVESEYTQGFLWIRLPMRQHG